MKKLILGALAGGFVYFVWSTVYWALSGVPVVRAKTFASEAAVEKVLAENAKEPGYYILPTPVMPAGLTGDAKQKFMDDRVAKIATGFFFAGAVRPGGVGTLGGQIGCSFAFNLVTALLITLLVLQSGGATFGKRFTTAFLALCIGTTGIYVMQGVWWGTTADWQAVLIFDWMFGWSLASAAIAKITG